jgi:hypothetical protein
MDRIEEEAREINLVVPGILSSCSACFGKVGWKPTAPFQPATAVSGPLVSNRRRQNTPRSRLPLAVRHCFNYLKITLRLSILFAQTLPLSDRCLYGCCTILDFLVQHRYRWGTDRGNGKGKIRNSYSNEFSVLHWLALNKATSLKN